MTDTANQSRNRPLIALTLSRTGHGVCAELARRLGVSRSAVVEMSLREKAIGLGIDLDDIEARVESGDIEVPEGRAAARKSKPKPKAKRAKGRRAPR